MRRARTHSLLVACFVLGAARSEAQATTNSGIDGLRTGYHGDTMWFERDTTRHVLIIKSDTGTVIRYLNDTLVSRQVFIVLGDSARLIDQTDRTGRGKMRIGDVTSAMVVTSIRTSIAMMIRLPDTRARTRDLLAQMPPEVLAQMPVTEPDPSPATPVTYRVSPEQTLVQHRDTVRYVRACGARQDTTTYLLFGTDSVRRLSPSPKTFGALMNAAVTGDVNAAFSRQLAERLPPTASGPPLPSLPDFCGKL